MRQKCVCLFVSLPIEWEKITFTKGQLKAGVLRVVNLVDTSGRQQELNAYHHLCQFGDITTYILVGGLLLALWSPCIVNVSWSADTLLLGFTFTY